MFYIVTYYLDFANILIANLETRRKQMFEIDTHWIALLGSILIYLIVGAIWYSPKVFGEIWGEAMGFRPEELTPTGKAWAGAILNGILTSIVLYLFIQLTNAATAFEGIKIAFLAWIGFTVPAQFGAVLWENRPFKVFLIHTGCMLVSLILMGLVLVTW